MTNPTHIALFPSAGMGHLTPFLRIAAALLSRNCHVTLITAVPTVSAAESSHISSFVSDHPGRISHAELQTLPPPNPPIPGQDPFFLHFEATRRAAAAHLRPLLLTSSRPISAVFADLVVLSSTAPVAAELRIPCYTVCTSSVRFLCVAARLPFGFGPGPDAVDVPGLGPVLCSSLPPPFKDPGSKFTKLISEEVSFLLSGGGSSSQGIIVNSFDCFESVAINAVNGGKVSGSLPNVIAIGPLDDGVCLCPEKESYMAWLDDQPAGSVVYVSFGSRTTMSREQIRELWKGLARSGVRFLWVLKTSKVDKDEEEEETRDLLGGEYSLCERGLVLRGWARQAEILGHAAVGAFVSHCGWNSVAEAARRGVPVVAWPLHGDQRLNAEVLERTGLGVWPNGWGSEALVSGDEIGDRIREALGDQKLRETARKVGRDAENAVAPGGTSDKAIAGVLEFLFVTP